MKRTLIIFSFVLALLTASVAYQKAGRAPAPGAWKSSTHLVFSGGIGNFPRVGNWLLQGMAGLFPSGQFTGEILFTGNGYAVEMKNIQAGDAQLAVTIPAATPYMASKGIGMFTSPNPNLRGFLKIPRRTFITFAVREDLGVTSIEDIAKKKVPLKLATGQLDGEDTMTFTCLEILKGYGITLDSLKAQGGDIVQSGVNVAPVLAQGRANAVCAQGTIIDADNWKQTNDKVAMRMLSVRQDVIDKMASAYGYNKVPRVFKKGSYPGVLEDVSTLDYADWIIVGDARIPDDLAYKIAQAGAEGVNRWLNWYPDSKPDSDKDAIGMIKPEPRIMWQDLGVPLHPGAAKYFKEKGYMP